MADKQDRWLDRETAERLLRGDAPDDALGPTASETTRDQAERLARTLSALSSLSALSALAPLAPAPSADDGELVGEAAALAAFRETRAAREARAGAEILAAGEAPVADEARASGGAVGEAAALAAFRRARTADAAHATAGTRAADEALDTRGARAAHEAHATDELFDLRAAREPHAADGRRSAGETVPAGERLASVAIPRPRAAHASDAGVVRIGGRPPGTGAAKRRARSRWSRPARLGLVAALAVGMVGGVAVVAGTGVLPGPFGGGEPATPAASVSAPASPERLVSPEPDVSGENVGPETPEAGGSTGGTGAEAPGDANADDDASAAPDGKGTWPNGVTSSCRDLSAGRTLDAERRRTLERLAGGWSRVRTYCADVLKDTRGRTDFRGDTRGGGKNTSDRDGRGGYTRDDRQGDDDSGGQDGRSGHGGKNDGNDGNDGDDGNDGRDGDDGDSHHGGHGDGRHGDGRHGGHDSGHDGRSHGGNSHRTDGAAAPRQASGGHRPSH
ncbi:hypothetical protein JCM4814A_22920 [Streptomyces phaeofaciens JCM 4814]|uniref:Uncharacterized protein n=1 Tax=Streptomyces phaeofaciens TaxID=68254 RepID=A0A918H3R8_9ACTN|nr:hypothetical protein [Streptomyces phaeofaciens]GGT34608.1 hypothetical protein GCM10010226_08260 [Streptomyces phaeofaciens]